MVKARPYLKTEAPPLAVDPHAGSGDLKKLIDLQAKMEL